MIKISELRIFQVFIRKVIINNRAKKVQKRVKVVVLNISKNIV